MGIGYWSIGISQTTQITVDNHNRHTANGQMTLLSAGIRFSYYLIP